MKDHLKYLLNCWHYQKSNVSNALYDKIVDLLSSCENFDVLCSLPKGDTILNNQVSAT